MYKKLFKELAVYGLGTIAPRLIMVIFNWIFTHEFKPAEYSTFNDVVFIDTLLIQVLLFGFETAIFRFANKYDNDTDILKTAYTMVGFFTILFALIGIIFYHEFAQIRGYPRDEYVLMGISIICCDVFVLLAKSNFRLRSKPLMYSLINISNVLIQAGAVLFLLYSSFGKIFYAFFTDRVGIPLLANVLSSLAMFVLVFPNTIRVFSAGKYSFGLAKSMLAYGTPIAIASISFLINESYDKISMKTILGAETTGAYGACYKIATFMALFEMAFRMGVEPFFFKQAKNENRNNIYANVLLFYTLMSCMVYLGIMANLDLLKHLMISKPAYFVAMEIVPIILMGNIMLGIYNNISVWYKVTDKTYFGMIFSIIGAGIMIFSCQVVMRHFKDESFNYMIPAWATLLVYGTMAILSYFFSRKYNPIPYPIWNVILLVINSLGVSYIFFFGDFGLFVNNIILTVCIGIVFLLHYKKIKTILKSS